MDAKEKLLNSIEERLAYYAGWVRRGKGSRSDASEEFYRELLNFAFGYELKNMNREKGNYPGIDLGDEDAGIAVQVTITETPEKVRDTLKQFLDETHGLRRRYRRLIVLVAGDVKSKAGKYETKGFDFLPQRDIWDTAGLLEELRSLPQEKLEEVEKFLLNRVPAPSGKEPVLHLPVPERRNPVEILGRRKELDWLQSKLAAGTKPVIVAGLGGIGKTELALKFQWERWMGRTYFARFRDTFTRTLADSVGMAIPVEERKGLNEERTAELALSYLRRCEPGDLLIVDNAEVIGAKWSDLTRDPFYEKIRRLPMAVLMTTRHRDTGGLWLGSLERYELRQIFRGHEVTISEGEMDVLIDAVDGHTMTVDMIARTIRESWGTVTASDILTAMKTSTLNEADFDEIENDHDPEQRQIYAHLKALFDLSGISEDGRQALRCATLLPQTGMDAKLFRTALPEGAAKEIKLLEKRGWVDRKDNLVLIHPVVRLVCRTELKPTEENCENFLVGIGRQYDRNHYDHVKFRQMAELFENASNMLEDEAGSWAGWAGYFWSRVAEPKRALSCSLLSVQKSEEYEPNSNNLATRYNNVGSTYGALGDYQKALEYKLKALEICENILPVNYLSLANFCNNVGCTYGDLGDHRNELEYKLRALVIRRMVLPANHPDLADSYNNLGIACGNLGDFVKALDYKLKALAIREKVLPTEHPSLAASYNNVGSTYGVLGDHEKALEYNLKAQAIWERVLPEDHPDLAANYNNVGSTYGALDDHQKALEYRLKALEILERVLPEDHPNLAANYNNVGIAYDNLGDHWKALECKLKALAIEEKVLPPDHPSLAITYGSTGYTYDELGNHGEALEYKLKALAIQEKVLPANHPDLAASFNNVGGTYREMGDQKKTLEYVLKALAIWEKVLPANHPNLALSYSNVAWTYYDMEQLAEAAAYMRRAAEIIKRSSLPPEHPDRVDYICWADEFEEEAQEAQTTE